MELGPSVLVVDDDARNRSLIRATLGGFWDVIEADSGPAALKAFSEREFELVLLDVMMPGLNGYDVCKQIKEQARNFLPVLLVTGLGQQEDRNRGLEAGADDFLTQPVDRPELLLRTRAFLRPPEQDHAIRPQPPPVQRLPA